MNDLRIKSIISPDKEIKEWPFKDGDGCVFVEIEIGRYDSDGADIFSTFLVTESHLYSNYKGDCHEGASSKKIVISAESYTDMVDEIHRKINERKYSNWSDAVEFLLEFMGWEYENYK